jgi:pyruvate-formate lyase-activating enzyme
LPGEKIRVNLLPYHQIAQTKYMKLGRGEEFAPLDEPDQDSIKRAVEIFGENGIVASIGG